MRYISPNIALRHRYVFVYAYFTYYLDRHQMLNMLHILVKPPKFDIYKYILSPLFKDNWKSYINNKNRK